VSRAKIVDLMEKSVAGRERRLYDGIRRAIDNPASANAWLARTTTMLKRQYLQEAALAAGGWDRLTQADYGRIGGKLQAQYGRLRTMAGELRDGTVTEAQALARMRMYVGNARAEYYEVERERLPPSEAGKMRMERRRLGASKGGPCVDCLGYAAMGWQLEGTLPVPTQQSLCGGNCRCTLDRKEVPVADTFDWIGRATKGGKTLAV